MNHVHWWLFALSFAMGLMLTFALLVRPAKRQVLRTSTGGSSLESVPRTTKRAVAQESPTVKIRAAKEAPTKKIPVAKETPTKKISVAKETPTTKIPVAKETPPKKIPVAKETPPKKIPVADATTKMPVADATTKIPVADATTKIKVVPYAPYGPGSARADADGNGPSGWMVKGRSDTRLYYTPDDPTYDQTVAQVWFKDEDSAARAVFTPWRKSSRK
jgi:uncharacterized membrane protein ArfC